MKTDRISWIDVARGIGIIIVIYAHGLDEDGFRYLFYSFHMPLFFFLSGLVFNLKKHERFLTLIQKAVKGILFPYLLFAFLSYGIWLTNVYSTELTPDKILHQLFGILYGSGSNGYLPFNTVLWFLPCLFVTRMTFTFLARFFRNKQLLLIPLFLFSLAGYVFSVFFPDTKLPFGTETALTAIVFFGAGFLVHEYAQTLRTLLKKHLSTAFFASFLLCILFATINYNSSGHQIDLRLNRLDNYFLFYLASFSGILGTMSLSVIIRKNSLLEYIGKYSLILFVWHLIAFSYISKFLLLFTTPDIFNTLRNLYLAPLYTAFSTIVVLAGNLLLKKVLLLKNRSTTFM